VLLCEDFEKASIDSSTWTLSTWGMGSATLDATRAARGSRSLHINQPAAVSSVVLQETKTFAATGNHFFGRLFLYFDKAIPALTSCAGGCKNLVHWTAVTAQGNYTQGGGSQRLGVRSIGGINQELLVNIDYGGGSEVGLGDKNQPSGYERMDASREKQWMCLEFEYVGQGESAEIRVWWDGREHPALHYSTANRGEKGEVWRIPTYDTLEFGFEHYQPYAQFVSGFDAWLDEIVVDDQRIGCAR
jgi:hypothetical protein